MAMSNCRECGKTVSTKAKTCPNCGAPKPAKKLRNPKNHRYLKNLYGHIVQTKSVGIILKCIK